MCLWNTNPSPPPPPPPPNSTAQSRPWNQELLKTLWGNQHFSNSHNVFYHITIRKSLNLSSANAFNLAKVKFGQNYVIFPTSDVYQQKVPRYQIWALYLDKCNSFQVEFWTDRQADKQTDNGKTICPRSINVCQGPKNPLVRSSLKKKLVKASGLSSHV